jgi:hypothetical protein
LRTIQYHLTPSLLAATMERIALLVPEVSGTLCNPQVYAITYADHYKDDILQLESEWEFLAAVLVQTWHKEDYFAVVHLIAILAPVVARLADRTEAEQILHLGIAASNKIEDRLHLAYFMNCLGCSVYAQGKISPRTKTLARRAASRRF